jgi:preprotein translocase subunit SecA
MNMAGRGVDIKLGGDPDQVARAELRKLGVAPDNEATRRSWCSSCPASRSSVRPKGNRSRGRRLFITGTERHESCRIDNQLRGRSGR